MTPNCAVNLTGARGVPHMHKGGKTGPQNFLDKRNIISSLQIFWAAEKPIPSVVWTVE